MDTDWYTWKHNNTSESGIKHHQTNKQTLKKGRVYKQLSTRQLNSQKPLIWQIQKTKQVQ
jgi:hypothetical protein